MQHGIAGLTIQFPNAAYGSYMQQTGPKCSIHFLNAAELSSPDVAVSISGRTWALKAGRGDPAFGHC